MEKKSSKELMEEFKKHMGQLAIISTLQASPEEIGRYFKNTFEVAKPKLYNSPLNSVVMIGSLDFDNGSSFNIFSDSSNSGKGIPLNMNWQLELQDNITKPLYSIKEQLEKLRTVFPLHDLKLRVSQLYDSLRDKIIVFDIKHVKEYDISKDSFYARYKRIELNSAIVLFINNRFKEMQGCKTYRLSVEGKNNEFTFWYFANQFDKKLKYIDQVQDIVWTLKSRELYLPDNRLIKKDAKRSKDI
jgi:hypothetical protein